MKKIFVLSFLLIFYLSALSATESNAPKEAQGKPKTQIAKSYSFAEELVELPIKPFAANKLTDAEVTNSDPQILKLYETAVNAEKQADIFSNPAAVIKAWMAVANIKQKNPFLQTANSRLAEWKSCIELFNRHQESLDKVKTLLASTLLTDGQKNGVVMQHLSEFGLTFGTQEVVVLLGNTAIAQNADFQAKIKETKQKRCEKNSGKDCFECAKATTAEQDQLVLFEKACGLRFQPGCEEVNRIKAAQDAEKAKIAAEEKRKADEFAKRAFVFQDEPINVINPFVLGQISEQDVLSADPKVLKMFEETVAKEKDAELVKTPGAMILAWEEITKITEKNPFLQAATQRLAEWRAALEKLEKHEAKAAEMQKVEADNTLPVNYRTTFAVNYLNEFGVTFGATEVIKATVFSNEISENEAVKTKIKEVRKQRCDLNSAIDCQTYGIKHSANAEETAVYLKKACDLGRKSACPGYTGPETVQAASAARSETAESPKEVKKEPSQEDKFKEELNRAGRKKRLAIATSTLVAGAVVSVLGGVSLYAMKEAKKDRDIYLSNYNNSTAAEDIAFYRKKTNDADKKRKTYLALGGVGIGVGAALIATGITFYSIEFEGEKEVKKKYNISFGASLMDGTLQFAINW